MTSKEDRSTVPNSIPISIVSNSLLLREGLVKLLEQHVAIHLVGSYQGSLKPLDQFLNPHGHTILLDGTIGPNEILAWIRWWRQMSPPAYVLLLELANDKDLIIACIENGVSGYTLRGASTADVADALQRVSQGSAYCSQEIISHLFERLASAANPVLRYKTPLTPRELEVLRCVVNGYSNKEIAAALVIELYTVKNHIHNILNKLSLSHRLDAAQFALERGWLKAESRA